MRSPNVSFALCAVLAMGLGGFESRAGVVYQNTTNPIGVDWHFNGTQQVGSNLAANIDINELTLAPGSSGMQITSLSFLAYNSGTNTVMARPTMYIWEANGAEGKPGTLLGDFVLPIATFDHGANTDLSFSVPNDALIIPGNMTIWAGIGYDNDDGATSITAAQLNALGGRAYHPATVGTDGPQAYFIGPASVSSDPAVTAFGTDFEANYGWKVQASAVPEPGSLLMLLIGAFSVMTLLISRR